MSYSGFFVRENIGQTVDGGQDPSQWSASPDIILCGIKAPPNTTDFTTPQGYATDYGNIVYMNQVNYVYLRALNATTAAATGRAWFYYAESDLCLWPSKWMSTNILVDGIGMNNQKIIATGGNQVCVSGPFLWTPPYFHDGSLDTLADVVAWFNEQFNLELTGSQKTDLTAYLEAVGTGEEPFEIFDDENTVFRLAWEELSTFISTLDTLIPAQDTFHADLLIRTVAPDLRADASGLTDLSQAPMVYELADELEKIQTAILAGDWA